MSEIPDPIERGEMRAERWADENIRGDKFRCPGCEKWTPLNEGHPMSADPYAPPICGECLETAT